MRTPAIYALYICLPFALPISAERHSARGLKNQQLIPAREQSSLSDRALNSSTYVPSSSTYDVSDGQTVELLYQRRVDSIISHLTGAEDIAEWLSTLNYSTGQWPDVNYATGCAAQRANWPAGVHWKRLLVMAGAWHGGLSNAEQYVQQEDILHAISIGMDWWFDHDFTNPNCLDGGGGSGCPCSDNEAEFWNTNWYANVIGVPLLVSQTCLLLNDSFSSEQTEGCSRMSGRSFGTFQKNAGYLTGANILDVARIGIDLGVRTANTTLISDAYARIHAELIVHYEVKSDGIREDGSFGQHGGLLYNGNYGKDYSNDVLQLEYAAAGTEFEANSDSKTAFEALIDGDKWMIYYNTLTAVLHWDFSALGRFISFPVIDGQATSSILLNLTEVEVLGNLWSSNILTSFSQSLNTNVTHANAGNLSGNRMFYANDYMVHRGSNYMSTVKMVSTRTLTSECVNSQNPLGFHLSDGALHTYIQGDEYEDISVVWDWQLIPGITVNYNVTPLNCGNTGYTGVQSFVGGVSDGNIGIAAIRYTNPYDRSLSWQKAWFFLHDDVQHIMISNVSSNNDAPIYSVLDQKRHYGPIIIDTIQQSSVGISTHLAPQSLWHANVGYLLDAQQSTALFVDVGEKTGNWSSIGTSTQPPATVDLFAAWLQHDSTVNTSFSYTAFPGISLELFLQKGQHFSLQSVQNDAHASALYDQAHQAIMAVFWDAAGGSVNLNVSGPLYNASRVLTISVTGNITLLYDEQSGNISVSDPSQTLDTVDVTFTFSGQTVVEKKITISFPTNHFSGSSVSQQL